MSILKLSTLKAFTVLISFALYGATSWAQEIDDVEAEMDEVISESDAAKSAQEYATKKQAEEKAKLKQAEKAASETAARAKTVKDESLNRVGVLEKETAVVVAAKKVFDEKTQKHNEQIAHYEGLVRDAEAALQKAKEENQLSKEALKQAQVLLEEKKLALKKLEDEKRAQLAEKKKARRELASLAKGMPGKMINMAKDCFVHSDIEKESKVKGSLKKGQKVSLAKVTNEGWFYAKGSGLSGFIHKSCE